MAEKTDDEILEELAPIIAEIGKRFPMQYAVFFAITETGDTLSFPMGRSEDSLAKANKLIDRLEFFQNVSPKTNLN